MPSQSVPLSPPRYSLTLTHALSLSLSLLVCGVMSFYNVTCTLALSYISISLLQGCPVSLQPALDLMTKFSGCLDTPEALALLPSDLPLDKMKGFLKSVLRDTASKRRNGQVCLCVSACVWERGCWFYYCLDLILSLNILSPSPSLPQIVHHLVKSENRQLHEQMAKAQSDPIRIAADRNCDVCQKRLGTTVFARYPNGIVVHLKCMKDRHVCPVTGVRFDQVGSDVKWYVCVGYVMCVKVCESVLMLNLWHLWEGILDYSFFFRWNMDQDQKDLFGNKSYFSSFYFAYINRVYLPQKLGIIISDKNPSGIDWFVFVFERWRLLSLSFSLSLSLLFGWVWVRMIERKEKLLWN